MFNLKVSDENSILNSHSTYHVLRHEFLVLSSLNHRHDAAKNRPHICVPYFEKSQIITSKITPKVVFIFVYCGGACTPHL